MSRKRNWKCILGCCIYNQNVSRVYLKEITYQNKEILDHLLRNAEYYTGNNKPEGRCTEMRKKYLKNNCICM